MCKASESKRDVSNVEDVSDIPSLLQSIPTHKEYLVLINLLVSLLSEYIKPEAFTGQSIIFFSL